MFLPPAQGLPQLSENAVKAIGFQLTVGSGAQAQNLRGQIAGYSDRVTSVLVPQAFLDAMHSRFGIPPPAPARLLVRARDPADPALVSWLQSHHYEVGAENNRLSTLRGVVNGISVGMGVLSLVLLASGLALFILIIRLLLAEARESLKLLREIGYSPKGLAAFVSKRFLPQTVAALTVALVAACTLNFFASQKLTATGIYWPVWIGWPALLAWVLTVVVAVMQVRRSVREGIR